jgi:hypothetical protein
VGLLFLLAQRKLVGGEGLGDSPDTKLISIAALQRAVAEQAWGVRSFAVTGVICAAVPNPNLIVLQDETATALLEVSALTTAVRAGDWLAVQGNQCTLRRRALYISAGGPLVVENDGIHSMLMKSGEVFLRQGMQPIKVAWFNGPGNSALNIEFRGPAGGRQKIPNSLLWHKASGGGHDKDFEPGVEFTSFIGDPIRSVAEIGRLKEVSRGIATNLVVDYRARPEHTALKFHGYIEIPSAGIYTFYLESDDGSQLMVGDPLGECQVVRLERNTAALVKSFEQARAARGMSQWIMLEGEVTFVGKAEEGLQLEIRHGGDLLQVVVLESSSVLRPDLLHQYIRVHGI